MNMKALAVDLEFTAEHPEFAALDNFVQTIEALPYTPSRETVACIAKDFGFAPYIGGQHVAVHLSGPGGAIVGGRLVLVRNAKPKHYDWQ